LEALLAELEGYLPPLLARADLPGFAVPLELASASDAGWSLDGELSVVGVTQPVTLAIRSVEARGAGFRTVATTRIDRYAFGVTTGKGIAACYLNVELTAVAQPA
jgi:polyisoprenoid-binding protein YceI